MNTTGSDQTWRVKDGSYEGGCHLGLTRPYQMQFSQGVTPKERERLRLQILEDLEPRETAIEQVGPEVPLSVLDVYRELVEDGYISGHCSCFQDGITVDNIAGVRITGEGRRYLAQLRLQLGQQTLAGKTLTTAKAAGKIGVSIVAAIIGTMIAGLVVAYIVWRMKWK